MSYQNGEYERFLAIEKAAWEVLAKWTAWPSYDEAQGAAIATLRAALKKEGAVMSYGTDRTFKSKAELKRAVEAEGADKVGIFGTSIFGNETASTVEELADIDSAAVIVGPNVYNKRSWYANAVRGKDGVVKIK